MLEYSANLIPLGYVTMQDLHDGRPHNARNGALLLMESARPFEGSYRFKVELLSFDITEAR